MNTSMATRLTWSTRSAFSPFEAYSEALPSSLVPQPSSLVQHPIGFAAVAVSMGASTVAALSDMRANGGRCGTACKFDVLNVVLGGGSGVAVFLRPASRPLQAASTFLYAAGLAASNTPPAEASTLDGQHSGGCDVGGPRRTPVNNGSSI